MPEVAVVLEADPLRRLDAGEELLVREALVDGLAERIDRDERDDRERRAASSSQASRVCRRCSARPAAAAAGRGCWSRD